MAKETWLQKRARLKREKAAREAKARAAKDLRDIAKAQDMVNKKRAADRVAEQRRKREQRRRNQGK